MMCILFYICMNGRLLDRLFTKYQMALSIVLYNFEKITLNWKHFNVCDYICHFFPCVFYNLSPTTNNNKTLIQITLTFLVFLIVSYNFTKPMNTRVILQHPCEVSPMQYILYISMQRILRNTYTCLRMCACPHLYRST